MDTYLLWSKFSIDNISMLANKLSIFTNVFAYSLRDIMAIFYHVTIKLLNKPTAEQNPRVIIACRATCWASLLVLVGNQRIR